VERLFGTLQDRLVVELHLCGACTLEQANAVMQAYLPRAECPNCCAKSPSWHGLSFLAEGFKAEEVFCFKYERTVALDNTVLLGNTACN